MDHEKHGCVWHIHGVVRGDLMVSTLWSTSELIVSDYEFLFTPGLQHGARNHHGYKCGMADAGTSRVRDRQVFLRFVSITFYQAP